MNLLHILGDRKLPQDPECDGMSGLVRAVLEIAQAQVKLGHDVSVASVGAEAWHSQWNGVNIYMLPTAKWAQVRIGKYNLDLRNHVPYILFSRKQRFNVIHGHLYNYMRFLRATLRLAYFHSDPFYKGLDKRASIDLKYKDFQLIAHSTNAQIAVSQFVGGELQRGFNGSGNVHVVLNGVDFRRFESVADNTEVNDLRRKLKLADNDIAFLYSGAIVPEKGVDILAEAFTKIAAELPNAHLLIAGSSSIWGRSNANNTSVTDYEQLIHNSFRDTDPKRVHFLGKVAISQMPVVYRASDIVVVPSVCREGHPLVVLEAFSCGKPVIGSDIGGLGEMVDKSNGIPVKPGNARELLEAMRALATDHNWRLQLGKQAHQYVQPFSWKRTALQLDELYKLLDEHAAKAQDQSIPRD